MGVVELLNFNDKIKVGGDLKFSSTNNFQRLEYTYDYQGRRVEKKEFNNNTLIKHTKFVYDGFKLIAEFDVLNNNALISKYAWAEDNLLTLIKDNASYYYMVDGNKNIVGLVDENAVKVNSYEYSPFGKVLADNETIAQPFKFSSEYHDEQTGLVYYNYRYYNPENGKWLKRDPIAEKGGYNLYAFVNNNPVNYFDNLGLWSLENSKNKNIYKADFDGESLESLALKLGMKKENWQCIWPVCYTGEKATYAKQRNNINKGDLFDVSNLTAITGPQIKAGMRSWRNDASNQGDAIFLGISFFTRKNLEGYIKSKSGQGASPLELLLVDGHSSPSNHHISGEDGIFGVDYLINSADVAEGTQDYEHAVKKIGPPRCWFTKTAKVYGSACSTGTRGKFSSGTKSFAEYFATKLLRNGATAYGTTGTVSFNRSPWLNLIFSYNPVINVTVEGSNVRANTLNEYLNEGTFWNAFNGKL